MKYYHKRIELLKEIMGGKCMNCGAKKNLEFDHIDPATKGFTITDRWSYSIQSVLREASKCQLLCNKCHKQKNKIDNGETVHGTLSMHKHYKCRCRPCMDAYNLARKRWRATAKLKGKKE